ncbi:MAG: electron transport complex subunit RsxC [Lachnospiraceae bacterium]|nr:electron transport complex subunit RsxC [Lachnospiraceae bacterium]
MALFTFRGGVHPFDGKALSKDKPIEEYKPKGDLVYPLSQHIGAPAKAIVEKGQRVLMGERIAEAGGFVSACICASVSGTVKGIEKRRTVTGDMVDCIIIENDGFYEKAEPLTDKTFEQMSREEVLAVIRDAGITGMGGAGFPTHVKLSPKEPEKIDTIIVNCSECEPYLTSDYRKMLEEPDKLVHGLEIMLSLFDNARGVLAVEDNKPDCIKLLKEKTAGKERISVAALKTKYPQGSERQLIFAVTGREINSKMLPADAGCVVNNTDTVIAINNAVTEGEPLIHRIVTVTGDAVKDPRNFKVYTGTDYSELIEAAGGFVTEPAKIISGGPMMGFAMFDLHVPVTKSSSALLCMSTDEVAKWEPSACINCGRCVDVCPSRLIPSHIADHAAHFNEEEFLGLYGMECVECGCCSYVCPAKRQLAQSIKTMRRLVMAKRKKK